MASRLPSAVTADPADASTNARRHTRRLPVVTPSAPAIRRAGTPLAHCANAARFAGTEGCSGPVLAFFAAHGVLLPTPRAAVYFTRAISVLANLNPWSLTTKIDFANADRAPLLLIAGR